MNSLPKSVSFANRNYRYDETLELLLLEFR